MDSTIEIARYGYAASAARQEARACHTAARIVREEGHAASVLMSGHNAFVSRQHWRHVRGEAAEALIQALDARRAALERAYPAAFQDMRYSDAPLGGRYIGGHPCGCRPEMGIVWEE